MFRPSLRPLYDTIRFRRVAVACVLAAAGTAAPTGAQPASMNAYYRWLAPPAAEQLAADATVVPPGHVANFVPALSDGASEPEALVFQDERQIASGPTGRRIVVAPGRYSVRVGSGPTPLMVSEEVTVVTGRTVRVAVRWGGCG